MRAVRQAIQEAMKKAGRQAGRQVGRQAGRQAGRQNHHAGHGITDTLLRPNLLAKAGITNPMNVVLVEILAGIFVEPL